MKSRGFHSGGIWLIAASVAACAAVGLLYSWLPDYSHAVQEQRAKCGTVVLDGKGRLLRILPDGRERFTLWCELGEFAPTLKSAVIAAEDRRFFHHPGFDPIAVLRAIYTNIVRWKTVSGASTITQQVVRLIHPRSRTYRAKIVELLASLKMEWQLTKEQILELHLNLSPMGGGIRGAALASRIYFGKDVERISLAEAAVLAALPRSPTRYSPRTPSGRKQLLKEKDRILRRMADLEWITSDDLNLSLGPTVVFKNRRMPMEAPHLVDLVLEQAPSDANVVRTTVDLDVQHFAERVLRSHRNRLSRLGIDQAGAIVASASEMKVLALVGSLLYGRRDQGFNNAVTALRSAGSTLKPFLYALALEKGCGASSEVPDTFRSYATTHGDYLPMNADRRTYGPVSFRSALGNSLNVSAVKILRALGIDDFYQVLKRVGITDRDSEAPDHYGLGLAIGNMEVSLYRLVQAYSALARNGEYKALLMRLDQETPSLRVFSPEVAYVIANVLADPSARLLTFGNPSYFDFGFPVSVKSGTSTNFRDAWVIGYTPEHVVGIWAGNFDGRPANGVSGAVICGPMLKEIMLFLYGNGSPPAFAKPPGVGELKLCAMSGKVAGPKCPHTVDELVISAARPTLCDIPHEDELHYLGAQYARWLHRRQYETGLGRFRLMKPVTDAFFPGMPWLSGSPPSTAGVGNIGKSARIEIVHPHNLDRFILTHQTPHRVLFRAQPDPVVEQVVWFLDGEEIARTPPPYEFFWEPSRGRHVVHAVTPSNEGAQVVIEVE